MVRSCEEHRYPIKILYPSGKKMENPAYVPMLKTLDSVCFVFSQMILSANNEDSYVTIPLSTDYRLRLHSVDI